MENDRAVALREFPCLEQGTQEWLDIRKLFYLTSSRFAAAIGLNPYCSRKKLWRQLMGKQDPDPVNDDMQFGMDNEDKVADMYYELFGAKNGWTMSTYGLREIPSMRGFAGSVDRIVTDKIGNKWVLEIKTTRYGNRGYVPVYHIVQCIALCEAMEVPFADYICWSEPDDICYCVRIRYKKQIWEIIGNRMLNFFKYVFNKKEPPRMNSKNKKILLAAIERYVWFEDIPIY